MAPRDSSIVMRMILVVGCGLADPTRGLDAVHARHAHVHEHDVGGELTRTLDRFLSGGGLADDDDDLVGELESGP